MIRLAIVGTRVLAHPQDRARAARSIEYSILVLRPDVIISGGAAGIDRIAELTAPDFGFTEENGKLIVHRPTVKRFHGPGGFRERDGVIAADCTHLLRIACRTATTYGSGWTADQAKRLGKTVADYCPCPLGD